MPAAKPADQRREVVVLTRLTRTEDDDLQAAADRDGITRAEVQRRALRAVGVLTDTTR